MAQERVVEPGTRAPGCRLTWATPTLLDTPSPPLLPGSLANSGLRIFTSAHDLGPPATYIAEWDDAGVGGCLGTPGLGRLTPGKCRLTHGHPGHTMWFMLRIQDSPGEPITRSLARGLAVLEAVAANTPGPTTTVIARAADLDKATVIRLLRTLTEAGYVARDRHGRYLLTAKLLRVASAFLASDPLPSVARPLLRSLRDKVEETVHLGALDHGRVVYIDKIDSPSPVQLVSRIGLAMPITTTALGKAIAAALDQERLNRLLPTLTFEAATSASITTPEHFLADLDRTRERGYALDLGENQEGAFCVGVAIPGSEFLGDAPLAISVSGPQFSMQKKLSEIGELCMATARRISYDLRLDDKTDGRSAG